ncbi:MAG: uracil-DNA glycosylase [Candidatus Nitrosotenuis sp.]
MKINSLTDLNTKIIQCKKCPRLAAYVRDVASKKVRRYSQEQYWGRALSGFGDPSAELLIVGLAPAAHGGNRTGRMFTGDSSGDWLARVLYENGLATIPTSTRIDDGFSLINTYITAAVKCAPPKNKPTREEIMVCSNYLVQELLLLKKIKVIICLGRIAFDTLKQILQIKNQRFFHGNTFFYENKHIICSYHPSRQNTQTGRLDWKQWNNVFCEAKALLR